MIHDHCIETGTEKANCQCAVTTWLFFIDIPPANSEFSYICLDVWTVCLSILLALAVSAQHPVQHCALSAPLSSVGPSDFQLSHFKLSYESLKWRSVVVPPPPRSSDWMNDKSFCSTSLWWEDAILPYSLRPIFIPCIGLMRRSCPRCGNMHSVSISFRLGKTIRCLEYVSPFVLTRYAASPEANDIW